MMELDSLKKYTVVVADTGDFNAISQYKPIDSTTNPSLIAQATRMPGYSCLLDEAIRFGKEGNVTSDIVDDIADKLTVLFGLEILKIIPGRVSTEIDASLSFDTEGTIQKAIKIIDLYKAAGISKERVLIKISSTWEGIKAAEVLERDYKIHCNLTLLFGLTQAIACAEAGVTLISPFVGRVTDFYKQKGQVFETVDSDPGVMGVKSIYNYYKKFGYSTTIMGASFRSTAQIKALTGIDAMTISPKLLEELSHCHGDLDQQLSAEKAKASDIEKITMDEKRFRWLLNCDEMATIKLAEGIRIFHADTEQLKNEIRKRL